MTATHPGASPYKDRHGKVRWRYRSKGRTWSLPQKPGDPNFEAAYTAAQEGRPHARPAGERRAARRSVHLKAYCNEHLGRIRARALKKGLDFALTEALLHQLMQDQGWRCAVSGMPFDFGRTDKNATTRPFRPSIDRRDPKRGYVPGNVRVVCEIINLAMHTWGAEPLHQLIVYMSGANRSPNSLS